MLCISSIILIGTSDLQPLSRILSDLQTEHPPLVPYGPSLSDQVVQVGLPTDSTFSNEGPSASTHDYGPSLPDQHSETASTSRTIPVLDPQLEELSQLPGSSADVATPVQTAFNVHAPHCPLYSYNPWIFYVFHPIGINEELFYQQLLICTSCRHIFHNTVAHTDLSLTGSVP